ncbi:Uncharacterized protein APZ42_013932 [Daphnia magna]|uniref:Uncharacterized protein n=1 Tax=Daphnia magna TaxID=35525 RepID=A0A162QDB7_9CRUS|nr:Uncharacterized protein APZ42_013932 [Daphnia magna]
MQPFCTKDLRYVPDVLWWPQNHSVTERNAIVVLLVKYKISSINLASVNYWLTHKKQRQV